MKGYFGGIARGLTGAAAPTLVGAALLLGSMAPARMAGAGYRGWQSTAFSRLNLPASAAFRQKLISAPSVSGTHGSADQQANVKVSELEQQDRSTTRAMHPGSGASEKAIMPAAASLPDPTITNLPTQLTPQSSTDIPDFSMANSGPFIVSANSLTVYFQDGTGSILHSSSLSGFFANLSPSDPMAPQVLYDDMTNHFVIAALDGYLTNHSSVLLAVSDTPDPTGTWALYKFAADPQGQTSAASMSTLGVNSAWIVVSTAMFQNAPPNPFAGSTLFALDKNNLMTNKRLSFTSFPDQGFLPCPTKGYDISNPFVDILTDWKGNSDGKGLIRHGVITGNVGQERYIPSGEMLSFQTTWDIFITGNLDFLPQQGSSTGIYGGDGRITNAVFRNNLLWATHSLYRPAGGPNHMAVHYLSENIVNGQVVDGFFEDPAGVISYAAPSIAVNSRNDASIVCGRFSPTTNPAIVSFFEYGGDFPDAAPRPPATVAASSGPFLAVINGSNYFGATSVTVVSSDQTTFSSIFPQGSGQGMLAQDSTPVEQLPRFEVGFGFQSGVDSNDLTIIRNDNGSLDGAVGAPAGAPTGQYIIGNLFSPQMLAGYQSIIAVRFVVPSFAGAKPGDHIMLMYGGVDPGGEYAFTTIPVAVDHPLDEWVVVTIPTHHIELGESFFFGISGPGGKGYVGVDSNLPFSSTPQAGAISSSDGGKTFSPDSNNTLTQVVVSSPPDGIRFTKAAVNRRSFQYTSTAQSGEEFIFSVHVENVSDTEVDGLTIDDPLPSGTVAVRTLFLDKVDYGETTHVKTVPFSVKPHGEVVLPIITVGGVENTAHTYENTAFLLKSGTSLGSATAGITIMPGDKDFLDAAIAAFGDNPKALGATGVFNKSNKLRATGVIVGAAAGPVILVNGVPQKTVPDEILPNNILIAPKGAKKIKPGQTVTIQVQFPDGTTTNSITYTRPTG